MKQNYRRIFLILIACFLLSFIITAQSALCQDDEQTIKDIQLEIRKTIKEEPNTQVPADRIKDWKVRADKIKTLLDRLLNRVERVKGGERQDEFSDKNPFKVFHDLKWKSFKFLVEYRKFLIDYSKKAASGKTGKDALSQAIIKQARFFRGESGIGDYSDLFVIFNVKDSATRLISAVESAGSENDINNALKSELEATNNAFKELKTITVDLEKIESQYAKIEDYFKGGKIAPELYYPVIVKSIPEVLVDIKKAISADLKGTTSQERLKSWNINVYETKVLLDGLLKKVSEERSGGKPGGFPGKNPFSDMYSAKEKSFNFLVKYRKFLLESEKYVEKHKGYNVNTLQKEIDERAHQFRGEAMLEKRLEINNVISIKDQCSEIINEVAAAGSGNDIAGIMKNHLTASNDAFNEYKTITNDLKELNRHFNNIKGYYEGSYKQPDYLQPREPIDYVRPTTPVKPTPAPTVEPSETPAPDETPDPEETHEEEPVSFDLDISPVPTKVGDVSKINLPNLAGGTPPYTYVWEVNGKVVSKNPSITLKFSKAGKYLIKITVTDSKGSSSSRQKEYNIGGTGMNEAGKWISSDVKMSDLFAFAGIPMVEKKTLSN